MKLVVRAPLTGTSGYAQLSRQLILGLAKHPDIEIAALQPLTWEISQAVPESFAFLAPLVNKAVNASECVLLQVSLPTEFNDNLKYPYPVQGWKRRIGYTMLETDRISLPWMLACNSVDGVIVPAEFNKKSFEKGGVTVPLRAIPPAIAAPRAKELVHLQALADFRHLSNGPRRFVFYAAGQWSPPQGQSRKGFEELIEAYFREFTNQDPVGLVLRTTCTGGGSGNDRQLVLSKLAKCAEAVPEASRPPIVLLHGRLTDEECESIWGYVDAFVLSSHGEGWGLDFAAAASLGIPIMTLPGSGTEAFLRGSKGVSWLNSSMRPVCPEIAFYSRRAIQADHLWAVADVSEIRRGLRDMIDNRDSYRRGALEWSTTLLQEFSEEKCVNKLVDFLKEVDAPVSVAPASSECLVVQPISLGDVFMVSAVVEGLRKKLGVKVDVMTKKGCQMVWEGNPNVREVLDYPDPFTEPLWRDHFDNLPKAAEMRKQYSRVYTPYHQTQIDFSQVPKWFEEKKHIVEVYAEACGLTPAEIGEPFIKTKQPDEVVLKREYFNKKWVVIHPWTGAPNKRWSGFEELTTLIHKAGRAVIQVGGPNDPVTVGVDKFVGDLHEAAWFLNPGRAELFIGVDSVMGHIAGSLGVPTFSLFGGTTASFSFPYWGHPIVFSPKERACGRAVGCHSDTCHVHRPCIETSTVNDVWAAVAPLL